MLRRLVSNPFAKRLGDPKLHSLTNAWISKINALEPSKVMVMALPSIGSSLEKNKLEASLALTKPCSFISNKPISLV